MQLRVKQTVLLFSVLLISFAFMSTALASINDVTLTPNQTKPDTSVQFSLLVKNLAGANVNHVEIVLPQDDNGPVYQIKEIGDPVGWPHESRWSPQSSNPFKLIWTTSGSGIQSGQSVNFNFVAVSPMTGDDYTFQWKTVDLNGAESYGTTKVTNFQPASTTFGLIASPSATAGKDFDLLVKVLDQKGNIKSDYTGTIKFSSSDPQSVLPSDYAFQSSDAGMKTVKIKLKTAGDQTVKVNDGTLENTSKIRVLQGDVNLIDLSLNTSTVLPGGAVELTVQTMDSYGNKMDVTKDSKFSVDVQAKGSFSNNIYTAQELGKWTILAKYTTSARIFSSGESLTVTVSPPVVEPQPPVQNESKQSLEIVSVDSVNIPANSTKTLSLTVKNTGETDLKNVYIAFSGFPENQMNVTPSTVDIAKGKSKLFTATVFVPEKTDPSSVTFLALSKNVSSDKLSATKMVLFNITEPLTSEQPSGNLTLNKNFTYLGIAIVIAVVLILLFWALFLKGDGKKKKSEKSE